eukprot:TRINITY_DN10758_c0_g1_i1.p1 TRINITY_DN10758_c0_g1~~TRINITY_DN10758_c0_g1_i1.p1  ORF type:complete len:250 (-),score=55.34 TRINITY_DN10758_c0_g1_i1:36-785(-)
MCIRDRAENVLREIDPAMLAKANREQRGLDPVGFDSFHAYTFVAQTVLPPLEAVSLIVVQEVHEFLNNFARQTLKDTRGLSSNGLVEWILAAIEKHISSYRDSLQQTISVLWRAERIYPITSATGFRNPSAVQQEQEPQGLDPESLSLFRRLSVYIRRTAETQGDLLTKLIISEFVNRSVDESRKALLERADQDYKNLLALREENAAEIQSLNRLQRLFESLDIKSKLGQFDRVFRLSDERRISSPQRR